MTVRAFYESLGAGRFASTEHTVGPWDPGLQHGGPPSALLAREMERCAPREGARLVRVTVEILGPVPVAELTVAAAVARPGRSVEMLEATATVGDRDVLRARGWRILAASGRSPAVLPSHVPPPLPGPEVRDPLLGSLPAGVFGYAHMIDWRFASGGMAQSGPAQVWTRLDGQVVAGEEPTGWQRVLAVADSGNGVSAALPMDTRLFVNPDLTVALHREPVGPWICLEAATTIAPDGVGLATSELSDAHGWLGRGLQTLYVAPR